MFVVVVVVVVAHTRSSPRTTTEDVDEALRIILTEAKCMRTETQ